MAPMHSSFFMMDDSIFIVFFVLFAAVAVFVVVMGIRQWSHNNNQPQVPAPARVMSKRMTTHHHNDANGTMHEDHFYYVTFAYTNGEQIEVSVRRREYDEITEGASGTLTMQGTRFIDFKAL